jgi:acetolactate synthase-1/2/3 large subunit
VFVECPVDLLYDEPMVRKLYGAGRSGKSVGQRVVNTYLKWHVNRLFVGAAGQHAGPAIRVEPPVPGADKVLAVADRIQRAQRPVLVVGSQATLDAPHVAEVAAALERIGAPVYLSGMARGLLGRDHPLQMRHKRREALKEADLVLLAGVPADFRLDYGNHIRRSAVYVSANRSHEDLTKNRKPDIGVLGDPGLFLSHLADHFPASVRAELGPSGRWASWLGQLRARDDARNQEIAQQSLQPVAGVGAGLAPALGNAAPTRAGASPAPTVNPLHLLRELDREIGPHAMLVADGGDFVATASYTIQPPGPLTWLDPGPFGTLGVGAGFALGAKLCRPDAEVWIIYGDGSAGYSLVEFDTFVRHGLAVIAVVGNDAGWSQIAREQVEIFGDDVATTLAHTDYHRVAEGFGGVGYRLNDPELAGDVLAQARQAAASGRPVLVNAILGRTDFRKGSISM